MTQHEADIPVGGSSRGSAMDDAHSGIDLSLLEGMDESLLARLHRAGIRSRAELQARLGSREDRATLAGELGVSARRVEVLHHLNFLMPEERADHLLELERQLEDRAAYASREVRLLWRSIMVLILVIIGATVAVIAFMRPGGQPATTQSQPAPSATEAEPVDVGSVLGDPAQSAEPVTISPETAERIAELEARLADLVPLLGAAAEDDLIKGVSRLGPAPGWYGPLAWTGEQHAELAALSADAPDALPARAVSAALAKLATLENAPLENAGPLQRARSAAALFNEFPPPGGPGDIWDASAILLRERLRARALGLAHAPTEELPSSAAKPWEWTHPRLLECENMMARLEALPVREDVMPVWSETLVKIRNGGDQARNDLGSRPESEARHYWVRRSELEFAVVGALLGRENLLPFHELSPEAFLRQRKEFLINSWGKADPAARSALAWLALEHEEALRLVMWTQENPSALGAVQSKPWVEAIAAIESVRLEQGIEEAGGYVFNRLKEALASSGSANCEVPWTEGRARYEAALRPLLMETRFEATRRAHGKTG